MVTGDLFIGRLEAARGRFENLESTLRNFTGRAVKALRDVDADVDKVVLEFGLSLGGEAGVPFVTKGKADSSLKVTVECKFNKPPEKLPGQSK